MNAQPGGIAPVAFHLRHISRSADRLLTYAEGRLLDPKQIADLKTELSPPGTKSELFSELSAPSRKKHTDITTWLASADLDCLGRAIDGAGVAWFRAANKCDSGESLGHVAERQRNVTSARWVRGHDNDEILVAQRRVAKVPRITSLSLRLRNPCSQRGRRPPSWHRRKSGGFLIRRFLLHETWN